MHVPNLMTAQFLLFIKSQFTTNAQNILHVYNTHVVMADQGLSHSFQKRRRSCVWYNRHKKCVGEGFLHFQLEVNTLGCLQSPHR